jgi:transposase
VSSLSLSGRVAGIDVHKEFLVVVVLDSSRPNDPIDAGKFGTTFHGLQELEEFLHQHEVRQVAMESTAQYWRPVWDALEGQFVMQLAQARSTAAPRGRKTDAADALRIAKRLLAGDLTVSYVPPLEQREWRLLSRECVALREQIGRHRNRIEVLLEQAHLKLSCVVSEVLGVSGRRILRAMLSGQTDPEQLAKLAHQKIRASKEELAEALRGNLTPAQKLALRIHLDSIERIETDIDVMEKELANQQSAHQAIVERLGTIPGIGVRAAQQIMAEVGPQAEAFASAGKLASWIGVCPGMNESGGTSMSSRSAKGNRYLRRLFCQIAWAATMAKGSEARRKYHKLKARLGPLKAIWAVAHYMVRLVWSILRSCLPYRHHENSQIDRRTLLKRANVLKRQLARIGYSMSIMSPASTPLTN